MASPLFGTCRRPPDEGVPDSQTSDDESQQLTNRRRLHDDIVPDSQSRSLSDYAFPPRKRQRQTTGWSVLRGRVRDATQQVRVLVFVNVDDPKACREVRLGAGFRWQKIGWMALRQFFRTDRGNLENVLDALKTCTKEDLRKETDLDTRARKATIEDGRVDEMLSRVAAHVLCGHVREYRPLLAKLFTDRCRQLAETFDAIRLNTLDPAVDVLNPKPWFQFRTQTNAFRQTQSLQALDDFDHTRAWACDENVHESKREAFDTNAQRAAELSSITGAINVLKCDATTHADDIDAVAALRNELSSKDKLMLRRMRKYRLHPTVEQRKQLLQFMGACRYTYNLAVAHFRATNVPKATALRDLYVTELSKKERVYPEGISPPPTWVYETPKTFRFNALRKFETNIQFRSRKKGGCFFTFCEDANAAKITHRNGESRAMLSIAKVKSIPIQCDPGLEISNEIQITSTNGLWYAVIPRLVRPSNYINRGRTVALDPGVKAFMTGVDLDGNALHVGRGTREHLNRYRIRIVEAQREMALIKKFKGHRSGRQWRAFARAKRAFNCATAKLNNCVKEMHYQTCFLDEAI